jgi:TRAP-type C4-dicarboxylate transport system permease small subunit
VDNTVAFIFLKKLLDSRSDLGLQISKKQVARRNRLIWTLVCLACLTWMSLVFPFMGITIYKNDPEMRRLTYRLGISFSPVMYFGALVFVYSVQSIFAPANDEELSSYAESLPEIKTKHKDYEVYIPQNKY